MALGHVRQTPATTEPVENQYRKFKILAKGAGYCDQVNADFAFLLWQVRIIKINFTEIVAQLGGSDDLGLAMAVPLSILSGRLEPNVSHNHSPKHFRAE